MRKCHDSQSSDKHRTLARLLADELRQVSAACTCPNDDPATSTITDNNGRPDITNIGSDAD